MIFVFKFDKNIYKHLTMELMTFWHALAKEDIKFMVYRRLSNAHFLIQSSFIILSSFILYLCNFSTKCKTFLLRGY